MEQANALHPDLILLGGDDCWHQPDLIRAQLAAQSIDVLVNRGLHLGPSAGKLFLTRWIRILFARSAFRRRVRGPYLVDVGGA